MKRFIKSAVSLSALLTFSLLCSMNPAAAQQKPLKKMGKASTKDSRHVPLMVPRTHGGAGDRLIKRLGRSDLSTRIVNFADAMKGKRVEPGQCTDLVNAALAHAGAKPGDFTDPKNYVWGKLKIGDTNTRFVIACGDIIQFEGCRFEKKDANGSVVRWFDMPHHTAIVKSATGTSVVLLHQNAGGDGTVREDALDLAWKTTGSYKVYRPVPK